MKLISKDYEDGYHERFLYNEVANSQRNRARLQLLMDHIPGGNLLEIGCGKGGLLDLARAHYEIEGIDISRHAIQSIRGQFGDRVRVANIEWSPLPSRRFDVIAAFNILEHLKRPDRALVKIYQALRGGGILAGSVPYYAGLVGRIVTRIGNFIDRTHVSTLPPDAWMRIFNHIGFDKVTFFGEIPFGRNHCRYLYGSHWPHFAFNLMFICQKAGE